MELHQLNYFVKVAEFGSFTRAAKHCLVSQPALSQQIIKLERELGQPLFERLGRRVILTDAGRVLLDRAQEILSAVEEAKRRIQDQPHDGKGTIALGAIPTVAPYLLPNLLRMFRRQFPETAVTIYEYVTERSLKACIEGELDLALVALPIEHEHLSVLPLFSEELLLVLPPRHHLARRRRVTVDDLKEEPFILLDEAHCLGDQVLNFCRQNAFEPKTTCHSAQLLTVQELVAQQHGISLVPEMAATLDRTKRRIYRSLSGKPPTRTLAAVWNKRRFQSSVVKRFIEHAKAYRPQPSTISR